MRSLFMSYLSCPAISFVLYKVAFWDAQDQTHIFLVFSTQSGVKQHEGLVRLQGAEQTQKRKGRGGGRGGENKRVERMRVRKQERTWNAWGEERDWGGAFYMTLVSTAHPSSIQCSLYLMILMIVLVFISWFHQRIFKFWWLWKKYSQSVFDANTRLVAKVDISLIKGKKSWKLVV